MATFEDIQNQLPTALQSLLMSPEQMQAYEDRLVDRSRGDIERKSADNAQAINERTFARGLGLSTVIPELQAENDRVRAEALTKARVDANNAAMQAQRAALGQAASYVASENARRQRESEFNRTSAQRANEFNANQNMQRSQGAANRHTAQSGQLGAGLGGLVGTAGNMAARIFPDEIKNGIKGAFNPGGNAPAALPTGPTYDQDASFAGSDAGVPNLGGDEFGFSNAGSGGLDYLSSFDTPDMDFGNLDLGGWNLGAGGGLDDLFNGGFDW